MKTVFTMGNFDGVHLGHQKILKQLVKAAHKIGGSSVVYTFHPHPAKVMAPEVNLKLLQTQRQKMKAIKDCAVDTCIVEPFTPDFAKMSPQEFFDRVILKRIKPKQIIVGHDLTFGWHRQGTVELLEDLCRKHGIGIEIVEPVFLDEMLISSTQIRKFVSEGMVEMAAKMLGRPFTLEGKVIKGRGIGEEINCHTANLEVENEIIPKSGVYITKTLDLASVTNIGYNPTFGGSTLSVETHILNFSKDIYGKKLEICFYKRLRAERIFKNKDLLKGQIEKDIAEAKNFFNHPFVVGLIGRNFGRRERLLQRKFKASFKKRDMPYVYLLLKTAPKYLKNIITCMKLMDVMEVHISPEYSKKVIPYLDNLDKSAKEVGKVSLITRQGKRFVGYSHF